MGSPVLSPQPEFTFDPEGHIYRLDGRVLPSVTQSLNEWREVTVYGKRFFIHTINGTVVEGEVMDNAAAFGRAIHVGAALILQDDLDWGDLDPALVAPLREFEKWVDDYKVKPVHIEEPMYSEKYGVAGTPDLIGEIQGFRHRCLVDFKTGAHALVAPQVYAYEMIYREQYKYRKPIIKHVLYLPKDGSAYQFKLVEDQEALPFFLSRLFQHNYLRGLK